MATPPRVCVLRAPGTNCDHETAFAFETCGAVAERVHVDRLIDGQRDLADYQILCIPGGFSYGDDVGAGVVFGNRLRTHLGEAVMEFLTSDKLVLGICNGFQVLLQSGILPDGGETFGSDQAATTTLTWNRNGKYTAVWVHLDTSATADNVFLRGTSRFELPVAHAEGRIAFRNGTAELGGGRIALTYAGSENGSPPSPAYPPNPNGSAFDIAGLSDSSGRVLGLMPHPERFLFRTQHPNWTRMPDGVEPAGRKLFQNAVDYFQ